MEKASFIFLVWSFMSSYSYSCCHFHRPYSRFDILLAQWILAVSNSPRLFSSGICAHRSMPRLSRRSGMEAHPLSEHGCYQHCLWPHWASVGHHMGWSRHGQNSCVQGCSVWWGCEEAEAMSSYSDDTIALSFLTFKVSFQTQETKQRYIDRWFVFDVQLTTLSHLGKT